MSPLDNCALVERERLAGKVVVESSPSSLTIESTSICNLRCVMCPHAIDAVHRPKHMPVEVMELLHGAMAVVDKAQLHGIGEPLASPAFWRAVENEAFHPASELSINTNLTLLNDKRLKQLMAVRARLTLNVSLDAATELTYRRIRGADFNEVIENIRRFLTARGDRKFPALYMNMTLMRSNIEEAVAYVELAHSLGADAVCFWHLNQYAEEELARYKIDRDGWHFDYAKEGLWNFPELSDRCLRTVERRAASLGLPLFLDPNKTVFFSKDTGVLPAAAAVTAEVVPAATPDAVPVRELETDAIETIRDCRFPWEWAMITSNGDVRPCCHATQPVGNLNEAGSFEEIWNGKNMQELRRDVLANRLNQTCLNAACKYVQNTLATDPEQQRRARAMTAPTRLERIRTRAADSAKTAWRKVLEVTGR